MVPVRAVLASASEASSVMHTPCQVDRSLVRDERNRKQLAQKQLI